MSGFFFKAIVHSVLFFSAKTCVVAPLMVQVLGGFQYQVEQQLAGRHPLRRAGRKWEYTFVEAARADAGVEKIEKYIWRR